MDVTVNDNLYDFASNVSLLFHVVFVSFRKHFVPISPLLRFLLVLFLGNVNVTDHDRALSENNGTVFETMPI